MGKDLHLTIGYYVFSKGFYNRFSLGSLLSKAGSGHFHLHINFHSHRFISFNLNYSVYLFRHHSAHIAYRTKRFAFVGIFVYNGSAFWSYESVAPISANLRERICTSHDVLHCHSVATSD